MIVVHPLITWMANAYLLENEIGLYLVDAGLPGYHRQILRMIRQNKKELKLIYITHAHYDHYGSAADVRSLTGARIAIHRDDAEAMSRGETPIRSAHGRGRLTMPFMPLMRLANSRLVTPPEIILEDGESLEPFGLSARVLHTPGHTCGSTCLMLEDNMEGLLAFVGDLVAGSRHPQLQSLYAEDWSQLPASLARVQAARPTQVYPGHGERAISGEKFMQIRG